MNFFFFFLFFFKVPNNFSLNIYIIFWSCHSVMQAFQRYLILKDEKWNRYMVIKSYIMTDFGPKTFTNNVKWTLEYENKMCEITSLKYCMECCFLQRVYISNQDIVTAVRKLLHSYFLCSKCHIVLVAPGYIFHNPHLLLLFLAGRQSLLLYTEQLWCLQEFAVGQCACTAAFGGKCEICADTTCPDSIFRTINV